MTLTTFNNLNQKQRSDIVWDWAFYLSKRAEGDYNIVLFSINDFFAEVYINASNNITENILGISKKDLHRDFALSLNHNDPLVKAVFLSPGPPVFISAA